ncbi:helix-turn-helix domain-containing protein [Actinoplanes teichomyceticus]|nr:helix-turn-helix transcriptional regulator [Actinoplanes teichomyceticus]
MLGRQLRILREECGISREDAAKHLRCHPAKVSRLELGQVPFKDADLDTLLTYYRMHDARERAALLSLNARLNEKPWWAPYSNSLAEWYRSYLLLESVAQYIYTYENRFIPGLLQTREYAEATIRDRYTDEEDIQRRVDVRMRRQASILRRRASQIWAIIDNAALEDGLDDPAVMRRQLDFLIRATDLPHVRIQIVKRGACAARSNSFSILRLRSARLSEVVYLEQLDDALFIEDVAKSEPYRIAWSEIGIVACKPEDTRRILEQTLRRCG